jgi:hypothetical protein
MSKSMFAQQQLAYINLSEFVIKPLQIKAKMIACKSCPCYSFNHWNALECNSNNKEANMSRSKNRISRISGTTFVAIPFSQLGLSESAHNCIMNSDITWGGADATLVKLSTLLRDGKIDYQPRPKKDLELMDKLIQQYGADMFVNMEA